MQRIRRDLKYVKLSSASLQGPSVDLLVATSRTTSRTSGHLELVRKTSVTIIPKWLTHTSHLGPLGVTLFPAILTKPLFVPVSYHGSKTWECSNVQGRDPDNPTDAPGKRRLNICLQISSKSQLHLRVCRLYDMKSNFRTLSTSPLLLSFPIRPPFLQLQRH